jgi:hypothetical protein
VARTGVYEEPERTGAVDHRSHRNRAVLVDVEPNGRGVIGRYGRRWCGKAMKEPQQVDDVQVGHVATIAGGGASRREGSVTI